MPLFVFLLITNSLLLALPITAGQRYCMLYTLILLEGVSTTLVHFACLTVGLNLNLDLEKIVMD